MLEAVWLLSCYITSVIVSIKVMCSLPYILFTYYCQTVHLSYLYTLFYDVMFNLTSPVSLSRTLMQPESQVSSFL